MDKKLMLLARRYARAYLACFPKDLTPSTYRRCYALASFFASRPELKLLLDLPLVSRSIKEEELTKIITPYAVPASCRTLCMLIVEHKRAALLPELFVQLADVYARQEGIGDCVVESSATLTEAEKQQIEGGISAKTGIALSFTYHVNPSLIAGIRCQTQSFVWEHSVDQVVRALENSLKR